VIDQASDFQWQHRRHQRQRPTLDTVGKALELKRARRRAAHRFHVHVDLAEQRRSHDLGLHQLTVTDDDGPNHFGRREATVELERVGVQVGAPVVDAIQNQWRTAGGNLYG
jgi:hypothetical protein